MFVINKNVNDRARRVIEFLMSEGEITFTEASAIFDQSPGIENAEFVPIPVRITLAAYPKAGCNKELYYRIQDFILDAVYHRKAAYLLDLVLTRGYVLVLTQNEGSAQFVRSLIPEMADGELRFKEPTLRQIARYYNRKTKNGSLAQRNHVNYPLKTKLLYKKRF